MGRRQKPYQTTWKEVVPGLAHDTDGKWRIVTGPNAGKKFREANEQQAVAKARQLLGTDKAGVTGILVTLGDLIPDCPDNVDDLTIEQCERYQAIYNATEDGFVEDGTEYPIHEVPLKINVPDAILWPWLAKVLRDEPEWLAEKTGDNRLMRLRHMTGAAPVAGISLNAVIAN